MPGVRGRIFVQSSEGGGGIPPQNDINPWLDQLATAITERIDSIAPEVYGSLAASKTPYKPLVIGFIPPDVVINHIPVEQQKTTLARTGAATTPGQSASGGKTGPMELVKTRTVVSQKALGHSIYNSLKKRGFSEADARRLGPLLVGHARAELNQDKQGNFVTDCFNFGNVHSQGPKQGGHYYKGFDTHGSSEAIVKSGKAKAGQKYETFYVGAPTLDEGTDRWVGATLGWKQVRNATNGQEFAKALRPDLFPESRGGNNGAYFTAGSSPDDPLVVGYGRNVQGGANSYRARNPDPTQPDPDGVTVGGSNEVSKAQLSSGQANVMTSGNVTDFESDDPVGGRTGRNLRVADQARQEVVGRQVEELRAQVLAVQKTPALYMLIAPQSFSRSYEHSVDAPKGRRGHIVHMWLEKPMTISCKGVTAAQYIFDAQGAGGLTSKNRVHSLSYMNLMSLVRMYKNNGYLFTRSSGADESRNGGVRQIAMSIFIYFDGHVYIGSFDDFSVTDSAEKPYNMEYNFKFTVRYDMEASSVTDAEIARSIGGR